MDKTFKLITRSLFLVTTIAVTACNDPKIETVSHRFEITDSLLHRLQIDTVQQASGKTDLTFSAKITANEDRKSELYPMVSGWINGVKVRLGDEVAAGQTLATVISGEITGFNKEVIAADAEFSTASRSLAQAEQLYKSGLSSAKEVEEARNSKKVMEAELKRAQAILKLNGGSKTGIYVVKSPIKGFVIEKNVTDNMQLRSDHDKSLFTIADISNVWAMISIYESDVSKVKNGDEVQLSTLSYPNQIFKGKIDKIYNLIDQESKVMNARVIIANPNFLLKPGMLGTVSVATHAEKSLPVIQAKVVIFDENKNYVLVVNSANKVRIQPIEISHKAGDKVYVSSGLTPGDRVIASRQVFLFQNLKSQ